MKRASLLFAGLLILFALAACAPNATPTPVPPTPDAKATETKIAQNIFATQTASVPTATNTPTITATPTVTNTPTNTAIPSITNTPRPTNTPTASPTPVAQDILTKLMDRWDITLVSVRRDKTIYGIVGSETAFGTWATIMFRMRNLQSGSDYPGKNFSPILIADGKPLTYKLFNTVETKAQWFYACCETSFHMLSPNQETIVLYSFDVPEDTKEIKFYFTVSGIPIFPTFIAPNFDQVPPRKK